MRTRSGTAGVRVRDPLGIVRQDQRRLGDAPRLLQAGRERLVDRRSGRPRSGPSGAPARDARPGWAPACRGRCCPRARRRSRRRPRSIGGRRAVAPTGCQGRRDRETAAGVVEVRRRQLALERRPPATDRVRPEDPAPKRRGRPATRPRAAPRSRAGGDAASRRVAVGRGHRAPTSRWAGSAGSRCRRRGRRPGAPRR